VPGILSHWSEAKISLARLDKFLRRRELEQRSDVTHNSQETSHKQALDSSSDAANVLSIVAGVFEWEARDHDEDDEDSETEEGKAEKAAKPVSALGEADTALLLDMDDQPLEEMAAEGNHSPSEPFKLREINMEVRRGELVTVIGRVGSGKTSLLNSMLGEMKHIAGHLNRNASALSYVSQRYVPPNNSEWRDRVETHSTLV
jgi:ABC-type glutathione transport system ATPase component